MLYVTTVKDLKQPVGSMHCIATIATGWILDPIDVQVQGEGEGLPAGTCQEHASWKKFRIGC